MAIDFKTPNEISEQYLVALKGLKPDVNTGQTDSDWYIRSRVVGGVVSGLYADQRRIADDAFPQSARREAIDRHLFLYFDRTFNPPTVAQGQVFVTGAIGTNLPLNLEFVYAPNGNTYQSTSGGTMGATGVLLPVQSVATGQDQNLLVGSVLTVPSPPVGLDNSATVSGGPISDGRDAETVQEAAEKILAQVRQPLAGGKVADYIRFAQDADPSVVSANVRRFPYGFGTVEVVITAGTTDIDTALNEGQPIVLVPSPALVQKVSDYIETQKPITDCVTVVGPQPVTVDVTINVRYVTGNNSTILVGQTLTQEQLVRREIQRAIYKTPPGGRQLGPSGYIVASEIEEVVDIGLSNTPYQIGIYAQILDDRQLLDLSATGANRLLLPNEVPVPGTITVVEV